MTRRFDRSELEPKAYEAMQGLEKYLKPLFSRCT